MNYLRFHQNFEDYTGKIDEKEKINLLAALFIEKYYLARLEAILSVFLPNIDETRKSEEKAQENGDKTSY